MPIMIFTHRRAPRYPMLLAALAIAAPACAPSTATPPVVQIPDPVATSEPPRPPVHQPPSPAVEPIAEPLEGTTWAGTDSEGHDYVFEFRPGGALHYTSPSGTWDNGTWVQKGSRVAWETNDHYADYEGTITGKTMKGTAHNTTGKRWSWALVKQRR